LRRAGLLLCLISGASFGAMAIFAKLAYDDGASVIATLSARFLLAASVFWVIVAVRGTLRGKGIPRASLLAALALGGIGYSTQAGLFFGALERIDASLASLLLYAYPAFVTVGAILIGRERPDARKVCALVAASGGVMLVLLGAGGADLDALGAAMALGSGIAYAGFLLCSDRLLGRLDPLVLSALVTTGAGVVTTIGAVATDRSPTALSLPAFGWIVCIALISTVVAVGTAYAGMQRVGPSTASILFTTEPVVTVALAALAFGESLAAVQLLGGAFVLSAVLLLATQRRAKDPQLARSIAAAEATAG
jgi:drug/metabolite transporter (DMT)-like permease